MIQAAQVHPWLAHVRTWCFDAEWFMVTILNTSPGSDRQIRWGTLSQFLLWTLDECDQDFVGETYGQIGQKRSWEFLIPLSSGYSGGRMRAKTLSGPPGKEGP